MPRPTAVLRVLRFTVVLLGCYAVQRRVRDAAPYGGVEDAAVYGGASMLFRHICD